MNIQIFGKTKCFDTKKTERFFKERRIKYQYIDLVKYGLSRGELKSIVSAVGLDALVDDKAPGSEIIGYLAHNEDKFEKLFEEPALLKAPIVRNGKKATVGYAPNIWENWR